ncbi:hypothetical protein HDU76_006818, partial [Blyttiomyces sp. JEL0837]
RPLSPSRLALLHQTRTIAESLPKEYPSNNLTPPAPQPEPEYFIAEEDYNPELHGRDHSIPEFNHTTPGPR